ncbi:MULTISPECIES: flagellar protein FlaG [unclassified Campylobacter]|uniref:flagellar protein FlaG n=1 Tax=unclassified Campylobacter TaxID=2593542 RepID=UPI001BDA9E2D|nr:MULTISPECIES: flagellar protein FlaG [unclassified Campylobacter]MBZ7975853.1 flagellar protein FlaG [Campylobacter sp. RM12637]MBZ7978902.1 flagellar protein FlaG [Campylobacter sp. RM12654]MBZ7980787.1 flagellar protein FlaG [Campylobacter sp. RM12642]MBZ7982766.1 flagellar protein FlaG [Campylobacter sp. RM12640]MBZ7982911.1 flagellar protein FlaG [Campylobacter sp. RM12647]MBZ7990011.1 flagellar protein FlaG [Campylobacter sp. RM12635]MBZ7990498.1 flagellar protein FlaG [Campylobacter
MEIFKAASSQYDTQLKASAETTKMRPVEQTHIETNSGKQKNEEINKEITKEKLDESIKKLNENMEELQTDVRFGYNDKINQMYVDVIATKSGQIIRKIPNEEVIKLSESMKEAIGIIFDKKS